MKFIVSWKVRPDKLQTAVNRFLIEGDQLPPGLTSVGRWHRSDLSGGWHLVEADSAAIVARHAAYWADLLDLEAMPVVEDAEAIPAYASVNGIDPRARAAGGAG